MDWDNKQATKDPYHRYRFGIPPAQDKSDFAFIQHMYSSLNEIGQVAVICSQGVLFRGNEESRIRENMIKEDIIEAVIVLTPKLFYGTGIPGCILVLNKNKPKERKKKIVFIHAAKEDKKIKDIADIYALIWYSDIKSATIKNKLFKIIDRKDTTCSLDNASLFLLTTLGNLTFILNFLGMTSISQYSKKFFTVITRCFIVIVEMLQLLR
jgi:hydroxymethylpyrimidine pyrophosphatase-like HAD family hydrolase